MAISIAVLKLTFCPSTEARWIRRAARASSSMPAGGAFSGHLDRLGLDSSGHLARDAEPLSDLVVGERLAIEAEAPAKYVSVALGKGAEQSGEPVARVF
jgi:hypothetical protein